MFRFVTAPPTAPPLRAFNDFHFPAGPQQPQRIRNTFSPQTFGERLRGVRHQLRTGPTAVGWVAHNPAPLFNEIFCKYNTAITTCGISARRTTNRAPAGPRRGSSHASATCTLTPPPPPFSAVPAALFRFDRRPHQPHARHAPRVIYSAVMAGSSPLADDRIKLVVFDTARDLSDLRMTR